MNVVVAEESVKRNGVFNAVGKARLDVLAIAQKRGYGHVPLRIYEEQHGFRKLVQSVKKLAQVGKAVVRTGILAGTEDTVLVQYPYGRKFGAALLKGLAATGWTRGFRLVVLVHDIDCLRPSEQFRGSAGIDGVAALLACADVVICHSVAMRDVLSGRCPDTVLEVLGPFDYLYGGEVVQRQWALQPRVVVAGNLQSQKSGYVYKLGMVEGVEFELFGAGYKAELAQGDAGKVCYVGSVAPEELVGKIRGQYGLVWDGPSIFTCEGPYGEYLCYNSPHKFSLYMAAGLPAIVWSGSALADFVKEYRVGIVVDTLEGLDNRLHAIGKGEYDAMTVHVREVAADIVVGNRLGRFL